VLQILVSVTNLCLVGRKNFEKQAILKVVALVIMLVALEIGDYEEKSVNMIFYDKNER